MERESVDGREGDDERTENERSPPPPPRSRPATRDQVRKEQGERRSSRSRGNTPAKDVAVRDHEKVNIVQNDMNLMKEESGRHRHHTHRSSLKTRSALPCLRNRDQTRSGLNAENPDKKSSDKDGLDNDSRASNENGIKKRRRFRLRNRNRNSRKRNHRQDRRYKPYTELSWEERKERDEQESKRAAMRRANRPTPYNTTQFLMEDHKVDTPDLSNSHLQCDSSDEIMEDDMNGDYLEKDFSAVYEEVQSERLESMSKEQLVTEVLALQRRVTELEEEHKTLRPSSAGESDHSSSGQQIDKGLRRRLESLSSLEGEVQRLRSENSKLKKASQKEPIFT